MAGTAQRRCAQQIRWHGRTGQPCPCLRWPSRYRSTPACSCAAEATRSGAVSTRGHRMSEMSPGRRPIASSIERQRVTWASSWARWQWRRTGGSEGRGIRSQGWDPLPGARKADHAADDCDDMKCPIDSHQVVGWARPTRRRRPAGQPGAQKQPSWTPGNAAVGVGADLEAGGGTSQ